VSAVKLIAINSKAYMRDQVGALRSNIFAGYLSQIYITLIGILLLPLYMKYMGNEAFGLVAFFSLLQAWFGLLDVGLTPTVARETARFNGGALTILNYRRLLRALEGVFLMLALGSGLLLFSGANLIASRWLQIAQLSVSEVGVAIQFMGVTVGLRMMCGFYRGVLSGAERLVLLAGFNSAIATARFVGVIPVLLFLSATPTAFFGFQLVVALVELAIIMNLAYRTFPALPSDQPINWEWAPLKPVLKFSLTIAFTSSVWILATQTDKLILSKILPLAEYGGFMLAVLAASSIMMLTGPISSAILPRMVKLEAAGDQAGLIQLYRHSTQFVAVLAGAVAVSIAFCAEPLLLTWTGDHSVARQAAPVLAFYALGNGVLSVAAFPYYLQYAKGNLRMHLIGNAVFVCLLVPATLWSAANFGAVGAGYVWLGMNLVVFILWLPMVHRKFAPGLNVKWYLQDVSPILLVMILVGYAADQVVSWVDSRVINFLLMSVFGLLVLLAGIAVSSVTRNQALRILKLKLAHVTLTQKNRRAAAPIETKNAE
jgi:O-antigen/teichoic acid export membrane protein